MRIIVVGGNGTIGKTVVARLSGSHEVIVAGRTTGDFLLDMSNAGSIKSMFQKVTNIDAVVCIAGDAKWDKLANLSEDDFYVGIKSKLMGQVNLVRIGMNYINDGGSFTLTTGILADDPVDMTTSAAMVNGAIHSFVKAAALELTKGQRINAVSAGLVIDAYEKYKEYFPGHNPVPMSKVVNGYIKSIEGKISGQIIRVNA